ncbi:hypothetical protein HYW20_07860 [Candidatus Woesearchaeota archaeon]|nr:hypothetical protein [Candidatus Woesearchaeota archaeon]
MDHLKKRYPEKWKAIGIASAGNPLHIPHSLLFIIKNFGKLPLILKFSLKPNLAQQELEKMKDKEVKKILSEIKGLNMKMLIIALGVTLALLVIILIIKF